MTYPELSSKYVETVCTAGVFEDGSPVRLYPLPYRYLDGELRFHKYQWIEGDVWKNESDSRPESYSIDYTTIQLLDLIPPKGDGWAARAHYVFQNRDWQFDSMDDVLAAHAERGLSLAIVRPKDILDVQIVPRPADDQLNFSEKLQGLRIRKEITDSQFTLFEQSVMPEILDLHFPSSRLRVHWRCHSKGCGTDGHALHKMQILDWEAAELQRREGIERAKDMLISISDPQERDVRFFLGNLFLHPGNFMIGGIWRPKVPSQTGLF